MAVEVVALDVRILAERTSLAVQCRHPVFLSWHTVATFKPEVSYYAKRFALDLAQSAETWPLDVVCKPKGLTQPFQFVYNDCTSPDQRTLIRWVLVRTLGYSLNKPTISKSETTSRGLIIGDYYDYWILAYMALHTPVSQRDGKATQAN